MPDLARIRRILAREELLVVVQDLLLTETAELADVVLPGATWGEKTGCLTNADRTVHLSDRAVDPPGEARADRGRRPCPSDVSAGCDRGAGSAHGHPRGHVFVPFHYGYWDDHQGPARAANELTITAWNPVSKQPLF